MIIQNQFSVKRKVRRMIKTIGCCIIYLKRIFMGDIVLDKILKPEELKEISIFE